MKRSSSGLYEYCVYYVPQLRFKNRNVLLTTTFDETAAPFIEVFFKDGRSTIIDCFDDPLHVIKQHFENTFCKPLGEDKDCYIDAENRVTNPYCHINCKPIKTGTVRSRTINYRL